VLITTSLASIPVTSAPVASQVSKPAGAKTGATRRLTSLNRLSSSAGGSPSCSGTLSSSHTTTDAAMIVVQMPDTNPVVRSRIWRPIVRSDGRRKGGSSIMKGACSTVRNSVRRISRPDNTATSTPSRYMANTRLPLCAPKNAVPIST